MTSGRDKSRWFGNRGRMCLMKESTMDLYASQLCGSVETMIGYIGNSNPSSSGGSMVMTETGISNDPTLTDGMLFPVRGGW